MVECRERRPGSHSIGQHNTGWERLEQGRSWYTQQEYNRTTVILFSSAKTWKAFLPGDVLHCKVCVNVRRGLFVSGVCGSVVTKRVSVFLRAITLDNTLVILSTVAPDAGRYYVQAVNDKNGENKTSQPITLSVDSE